MMLVKNKSISLLWELIKTLFHCKFFEKKLYCIVLTPNMAALSVGLQTKNSQANRNLVILRGCATAVFFILLIKKMQLRVPVGYGT